MFAKYVCFEKEKNKTDVANPVKTFEVLSRNTGRIVIHVKLLFPNNYLFIYNCVSVVVKHLYEFQDNVFFKNQNKVSIESVSFI